MARSLILPSTFETHNFLSLMRRESNPRHRFRLLAMHHLQQGKTLKEVAQIVQYHWKTVQSWLARFRACGFEGLYDAPRVGTPKKISPDVEQWLTNKLMSLCQEKTGGYITGQELQTLLLEEKQVKCRLKTVYNTWHRLNFSWVSSRSMHPKSNPDSQAAYKKTSQPT